MGTSFHGCQLLGTSTAEELRLCMHALWWQVWVGLAGQAPVQAATETARKPQARRASGRRKTGEDATPPLPSLILGRAGPQHS